MALLGDRLRRAREARGISTYQVEIDTRIRATVIDALEQGNYENLPPDPFLRGLIRTYSTYLGLDAEETLALYLADSTPLPPPPPGPVAPPITKPVQVLVPPRAAPPSMPEEFPEPTRRKIAPPPLMPKPLDAPEELASPESLAAKPVTTTEPLIDQFKNRLPKNIPVRVIAIAGGLALLICFMLLLLAVSQAGSFLANLQVAATPTRIPPTRTPTVQPGALPTSVPTIAATAPAFPTFPGNPTPTLAPSARRTADPNAALNLQVTVTDTIKIQVGVDGTMVFDGSLTVGAEQSWSAKDSLYVFVENPLGAVISLNGNVKWFAPRNFGERTVLERQWSLNDRGTPVSETPIPPVSTPRPTQPSISPTPTLTPLSFRNSYVARLAP